MIIYIIIIIVIVIIFFILDYLIGKSLYKIETFSNEINEINIDNLFSFCNNNNEEDNVYYSVRKDMIANGILTLSIKDNKILCSSNEYLSLIKRYYPNNPIYNEIIDFYKFVLTNIKNNTNIVSMNNDNGYLLFITTFSTGTNHGYAGLFNMLIEYTNNYEKYKKYNIILYKNSQQGIKDIIEYLVNKNIVTNNIIYIDPDIIYKFNNIVIIPNNHHVILGDFALETSKFIETNLIKNDFSINFDRVAIIKSSKSNNLTNDGLCNVEDIENFSVKNNLNFIEPTNYNEVDFINILHNATFIVMSWGTTFFKNYYYASDKCTGIVVLIIHKEFKKHYEDAIKNNTLIKKFKNADITYIIPDKNISNFVL
jgi:hypothetical protein